MAADAMTSRAGPAPLSGLAFAAAIGVLAMANFMAVLDMTIVNVSVPHIAGSMAVSVNEGTWAITSYSIAEAVMVPLTGWLASVSGRSGSSPRPRWDLAFALCCAACP